MANNVLLARANMKINLYDLPDVEPIAIELNGEQWLHPYIDTWFKPNTGEDGNEGLDEDTYVFIYRTDTDFMRIMIKSDYVTEGFNKFYNDDYESLDKNACFRPPYMDMSLVFEMLYICLIEDTWSPRPNIDFKIKTSRDYAKFKQLYPSEQFCFTEFGEKVGAVLNDPTLKSHMTPDCGMCLFSEDGIFQ